jgi:hypothetical protein
LQDRAEIMRDSSILHCSKTLNFDISKIRRNQAMSQISAPNNAVPVGTILPALRAALTAQLTRSYALLRRLGPYAAIELVLPGGSLVALLLWLYRQHRSPVRHV